MTASDPLGWLRATAPFDGLPEAAFARVAGALEIGFWPAGTRLVRAGGEPLRHLYVVRRGSVRLEREDRALQLVEEGESFGSTSLITGEASLDAVVEEDLLGYRFGVETFRALLGDPRFSRHFAIEMSDRLRSALERGGEDAFRPDLSVPVENLVKAPALWVKAELSVGEVAALMEDAHARAALVRTDPPGIVTVQDFRNRVLAEGLGPTTPVTRVFSRPLRTIDARTSIHEAWAAFLDSGVHHLPITRGEEVVGVVAASDLLRYSARGPIAVLRGVERITTRDELPGYSARVVEMASSLLAGGLDVLTIAGFVARLNDALVQRLLRWSERDVGRPPAAYAWLALGADGRMERTVPMCCEDLLVWEGDADAAHAEFFRAFAAQVRSDLAHAGLVPMSERPAREPLPVAEFALRLADPAGAPEELDFRRVGGGFDASALAIDSAEAALDLHALARAALAEKPPAVGGLRLYGAVTRVDLEREGIAPIVSLARCLGILARARGRGTLERLEAARAAGLLDPASAESIPEAFRYLLELRLRLQLRAIAGGREPPRHVALAELNAIERSRLKDALDAIREFQGASAGRFGL